MENNFQITNILEVKNLTKSFPGVLAVDSLNFDLFEGEIHAICGENGAGKSTFVKMLEGSYTPDEGQIILNGHEVRFNSPREAFKSGIAMVHQELMLIPHLSIAENICFPLAVLKNKRWVDWKELNNFAKLQLKKLGINYDTKILVRNLTIAQQQIISIAKALASNCKLLILDEPTSALSGKDIRHLFKILEELKKHKISIIFISHRLNEILEITDRCTILRDSRKIGTFHVKDLTEEKIAELIVGRPMKDRFPKIDIRTTNEEFLRVENLNLKNNKLLNISFHINKSEILGIVGAMGAGKTELALTLFGAYDSESRGKIFLENKEVLINSPINAIQKGISLIPEDRRGLGLIMNQGIRFNMSIAILKKINKWGLVQRKLEEISTTDFATKLRIKCTSIEQLVENLSGGNQQKVIIARWLIAQSRLIIMDEPTRGIDVGVKLEIYRLIKDLALQGKSIIFLSSEVPEICNLSHRILILYKGKIIKEANHNQLTESEVQRLLLIGR